MAFVPAHAKDLRIGLYVKMAGSWFSHPFPANTFKITSAKELATLRSLKNIKILYDPDLSDPVPTLSTTQEEEGDKAIKDQPSPSIPQTQADSPEEAVVVREERVQAFEHRRHKLIEAEQSYKVVLTENKALMRDVSCGLVKGMRKAEEMVQGLSGIIGSDGTLVALMNLSDDNEDGNEFYYHSLNTAILSMIVAKELKYSDDVIRLLGLGALFHDIGETAYKESGPTRQPIHVIRKHPEMGKNMVEKGFNFPEPSLEAIHQHHERMDGSGYPRGLKGEAIHQFSKIIMVVDAYDELCNNPDLQKSLTPYEAMCSLYAKRHSEFWEDAVVILIKCLGVYPPSSIVELSDQSIGVVSTINFEDRLRPLVLLYAPDIPRNEAIILDLAQETRLSIKKSLRPSELPKEVWDYLNPRCMTRYFPFEGPENTPSASVPTDLPELATHI